MYDVSDYKSQETLNKGMTHEQMSDSYMDDKMDEFRSKNTLKTHDKKGIPGKGFEK